MHSAFYTPGHFRIQVKDGWGRHWRTLDGEHELADEAFGLATEALFRGHGSARVVFVPEQGGEYNYGPRVAAEMHDRRRLFGDRHTLHSWAKRAAKKPKGEKP